ncbi:SDR family NAD(P)-dependent oxidoreductase [Nocardia sp. BSTN01]|uniref:SDR family oxidoreductase n=1 Tax=Nocardia sp. BSTN01 TaxID=2783665 RepID=UPI00188EBB30|nr:SDR family oxidoreductase [Nocardia sp. BSTN01]MBF4997340.1 SDR family NAD(P)-dependent oxidoreductase [Nocardia sp. BSTN01]
MGHLDGRVAIITGAGRGIGREHALLFAAEGAKVVVNDLGGASDGSGQDLTAAESVVEEIRAAGGEAVANGDDVTDSAGAQRLIDTALDAFGELHVLVNNAGILRDRLVVSMSDSDWDDVIRVHLRGHFMPLRAAGQYWRAAHKDGKTLAPAVINTASTSGLFGNPGQGNYGAAKAAIASLTIIGQMELGRYGVRLNAICPTARTRLTEQFLGEAADGAFDPDDPANVAPFVAYLATENCPLSGRAFYVHGGAVHLFQPWSIVDKIETDHRWTLDELEKEAPRLADVEFKLGQPWLSEDEQ